MVLMLMGQPITLDTGVSHLKTYLHAIFSSYGAHRVDRRSSTPLTIPSYDNIEDPKILARTLRCRSLLLVAGADSSLKTDEG